MAANQGLGPVFAFEWLRTSRRWQIYASRSLFVGLLLIGLAGVWKSRVVDEKATSIAAMAQVGQFCFQTIVTIQLVLVMLAAPAATAGAICLDKARGTLAHLLVTDLSDTEIVLGKLAARLVPVVGLIACALPVTALGTLLGGIDPVALTGAFLATLGVAVFGCTLALTFSVWGKKTHEVLLATYTVWLVLILAGPTYSMFWWSLGSGWSQPEWLDRISPIVMVTASSSSPGRSWPIHMVDQLLFGVEALVASAVLAVLAVRRVRAVTVRQLGREERRKRRFTLLGAGGLLAPSWDWLPGPSLDGNPVLWREWRGNRPSGWIRLIWSLYVAAALVVSVFCIFSSVSGGRSNRDFAAVFNGMQVTIGMLMLSVMASNSLSEERVRGSLDVLLATPMPTSAIVLGKWWGAFRNVPFLAILPFWVAVALAGETGHWTGPFLVVSQTLAYGAALTSLGLALATWCRRPGRATAICVTAYTLDTIGTVFLAMLLFSRDEGGLGFAMASPFFGAGFFSAMIGGTGGPDSLYQGMATWAVFWTTFYASVAASLLFATFRSFDHCLGRVRSLDLPPPGPLEPEPRWAALVD